MFGKDTAIQSQGSFDGFQYFVYCNFFQWLCNFITALGALEATGVSYEVSKRWPDFVETIAGQRNKGQAGWLYKVNEEVPLVAAGKKQLAAGDRVIWWYSRSINNPAPVWEQFVKSTEQ